MELDDDTCYRALRARDSRFDGRFFVGVRTTGIYCRPICRVKLPLARNCRFYPSAAAAEREGYRPCLRCRPELAPGRSSVEAGARLAQAAAALLDAGAFDSGNEVALANELGVSARHLRRVFDAEFGVAPVAYAQTRRLLLAKQLLTDTPLPVTEVAYASGFSSLRRFNAAFRERYRLTPTALRRESATRRPAMLRFRLAYRPPYDWAAMQSFLAARVVAGVESVRGGVYRRSLRAGTGPNAAKGWIELRALPRLDVLELRVSASLARWVPQILNRARHAFDTQCDPAQVAEVLGELAQASPGLRLPGSFDGFEVAVRAVLGQQVSVAAAHTLASRFAARFGEPLCDTLAARHGVGILFPTPAAIADLDPACIGELGVIRTRSRTIVALARALVDGELRLAPDADVAETVGALHAIRGIGDWTAQYVAMRALGWPDAFPAADLVVLKALGVSKAGEASRLAAAWRPWRAYAVIHLWRRWSMSNGAASPSPHEEESQA
ncbi:MAG: helix-turn-helix domain-containing protein [Burkholderiaceae bacterium]|nr:helix-turn-helix domain-containing protein [Burkholderiaceae bacterium]